MKSQLALTLIACLLPPLIAMGVSEERISRDQELMKEDNQQTTELKESPENEQDAAVIRPSDEAWSKQHEWKHLDRVGDMTK